MKTTEGEEHTNPENRREVKRKRERKRWGWRWRGRESERRKERAWFKEWCPFHVWGVPLGSSLDPETIWDLCVCGAKRSIQEILIDDSKIS